MLLLQQLKTRLRNEYNALRLYLTTAKLTAGDILGLTVPEKESVSKDILAAAKEKGISIKVESTSGTPTSWSFA